MSEHAPEEWKVGEQNKTYAAVCNSSGSCVCICRATRLRGKDHYANAQLIAAVPELIKEIEALLTYLASPRDAEGPELTHNIGKLRLIITKARTGAA